LLTATFAGRPISTSVSHTSNLSKAQKTHNNIGAASWKINVQHATKRFEKNT